MCIQYYWEYIAVVYFRLLHHTIFDRLFLPNLHVFHFYSLRSSLALPPVGAAGRFDGTSRRWKCQGHPAKCGAEPFPWHCLWCLQHHGWLGQGPRSSPSLELGEAPGTSFLLHAGDPLLAAVRPLLLDDDTDRSPRRPVGDSSRGSSHAGSLDHQRGADRIQLWQGWVAQLRNLEQKGWFFSFVSFISIFLQYHQCLEFQRDNSDSLFLSVIPVVPHKAVAEVSEQETYRRRWLLWIRDGRAKPLIDRKVVGVVFAGVVAMVAVVTSPTTAGCSVMYCNCSCSCSVVEL